MLKIIISTMFFLCAANTYSSSQYYDLTIKEISLGYAGEGFYLGVKEDIQISDECANASFLMVSSSPMFNENYSMVLAAYMSGKKVGLYVNGCSGTRMNLKAVRVKDS